MGELGRLFPPGTDPNECFNPAAVKQLCSRFGVSEKEAVFALRDARGDVNAAVNAISRRYGKATPFGSYGLVALESYAPETFCVASFNLPSFDATQSDDLHDALHELILSAAELPVDLTQKQLISKFCDDWTTEGGELCSDVMRHFDVTVGEMWLLPFGEYAVQGFSVLHPVNEECPNIGTAASACCLDLRTGIHNRFRLHVNRIADSMSDHVVKEHLHFGQDVHLLRQPFWFNPEYSIEEFLRFKESLLQPSAAIFEMRYGAVFAPVIGVPAFRNIIELEALKIAQHKHEKHYEKFTNNINPLTADSMQLQTTSSMASSGAPGAAMHAGMNAPSDYIADSMETRVAAEQRIFARDIQAHGDRVFSKFYRNNYH
jgi:hypothetical protein